MHLVQTPPLTSTYQHRSKNATNMPSSHPNRNSRRPTPPSPRSPSRAEESSIRRGAEIIRRQIQKQMIEMSDKLGIPNNNNSNSTTSSSSNNNNNNNNIIKNTTTAKALGERTHQPFAKKLPTNPSDKTETRLVRTWSNDDEHTDFSDPFKTERNTDTTVQVQPQLRDLSQRYSLHRTKETNYNPAMRAYPIQVEMESAEEDGSDIDTINDSNHDPFAAERDLLTPQQLRAFKASRQSPSAASFSSTRKSVTKTFAESVFTYEDGNKKAVVVSPSSPDRDDSSSGSTKSSLSEPPLALLSNPLYQFSDSASSNRMQHEPLVSYLPVGLTNPNSVSPSKKKTVSSPSITSVYTTEIDEQYVSPVKHQQTTMPPVSTIVVSPAGMVSQLTTPRKGQPRYGDTSLTLQRYSILLNHDEAYRHASQAGFLWQSMVGQHVRFPSLWWDGARGPTMDESKEDGPGPWMYLNRQSVDRHPILNQLVRCRASGGRLLLHIVVLDLMTRAPVQDVVIGCFHPNAKGIRDGSRALGRLEQCRDVWLAIRKRTSISVSAVDSLLYSSICDDNDALQKSSRCGSKDSVKISRSPLGSGQRVTNLNVRSVFGGKPPLETIFVAEDELYERLSIRLRQTSMDRDLTPAMAILQEFVFA